MVVLTDWKMKGFDLTYDGVKHNDIKFKDFVLYPEGYCFTILGVNYATSIEGMEERINIVDNAILNAHNFNFIN